MKHPPSFEFQKRSNRETRSAFRRLVGRPVAACLAFTMLIYSPQPVRADCTGGGSGSGPGGGGPGPIGISPWPGPANPVTGPQGNTAPWCYVEYQTTSANSTKCGWDENYPTQPPRIQVYVSNTTLFTFTNYSSTSTTNLNSGYCDVVAGGTNFMVQIGSESDSILGAYNKTTCNLTTSTTGSYLNFFEAVDDREWFCGNGYDPCAPAYQTNYFSYYKGTANVQTVLFDGQPTPEWVLSESLSNGCAISTANCGSNNGTVTGSTDQVTSAFSFLSGGTLGLASQTPTIQVWTNIDGIGVAQETITLSNLFSDQDLYNKIQGLMPAYSGWYTPTPDNDYIGQRCAYSEIDPTHIGSNVQYGIAQLQNMMFRFAVPDSKINTQYTISWDLYTYDTGLGTLSVSHSSTNVFGTGDPINPVYSEAFVVSAPNWSPCLCGFTTFVITWVDDVQITVAPVNDPTAPVSGPYLGSSLFGGRGCATCGSVNSFPGSGQGFVGVCAAFSLGQAISGFSAGALMFSSSQPSLTLASPAALMLSSANGTVQPVIMSNQLRQVLAPQTLVDIITDDSYTYELRFYLTNQYSGQTNSQGLYTPIGNPTPFVTWAIANPDRSSNTFNRLQITETRGSMVNMYTNSYNSAAGSWTTDYPGGLREDVVTTTFSTNSAGSFTRTIVGSIGLPGGSNQFQVMRVYNIPQVSIGAFNVCQTLAQEIFSPGSNPQTNTYTYNPSASTYGSILPLQTVVNSDGTWRSYTNGGIAAQFSWQVTDIGSAVGDSPITSDAMSTAHATFSYSYGLVAGSGDGGTISPNSPRMIQRLIDYNVVSCAYQAFLPFQTYIIQCQKPNPTGWNDPSNLITTNNYYNTGPNMYRLQSVQNPDGTMAIYQYAQGPDGSQTNTVSSGAPGPYLTNIIDGTKDVTILNPVGQLISHTIIDIASGITTLQDLYSNPDGFGRPQQVTHLDNTVEYTVYGCCGVESTTDRDGVTTVYSYDALKRPYATTRLGITTTSVLDAVGRTLQTIRTGTSGPPMVLSQSQFDLASRLVTTTNGLLGVTSYVESSDPTTGGLIRTTTNPDTGTRIEAYFLDGTVKKVTGTAAHGVRYETDYDQTAQQVYRLEVKLNASGGDTSESTQTYGDALGRPCVIVYADGSSSQSAWNSLGQLAQEQDPDGLVTLYQYNPKGQLAYTAQHVNNSPSIDWNNDRITYTISDVTTNLGVGVNRTRNYVWDTFGANSSNIVSMAQVSTSGLQSWQTTYRDANALTPVVSYSQTLYGTNGNRWVTNTAPDGSYTVIAYSSGLLSTVTRYDANNHVLLSSSYAYDPQGRQASVTDARNGTTSYTYNNADLVATVTTPNPGPGGGPPQTTTTYYNALLQATNVVNPDNTSVGSSYLLTGELGQSSGSRTYPVAYAYDYAGRIQTMTTWTNFTAGTGAATTTWNYDPERGWLTSKIYTNGTGPTYTYTFGGRLSTRAWARAGTDGHPIVTTNTFGFQDGVANQNFGDLVILAYSANDPQSTPGVSYTYDRRGRMATSARNGITTTLAYNNANETLSEAYSGGTLSGLAVTNGYDTYMRRTSLTALNAPSTLAQLAYGYDAASRLQTVTDNSTANPYSATYSYLANSPLVSQIVYANNGATRMTTTKQYDFLNRPTQVSSTPSGASAVAFNYSYNSANQRVRSTLADGSYWIYIYDSLGQVISGHKFFSDETPVPGQEFDYRFDTIGNRNQTLAGGDQNGANQRQATYTANNLNQYTQRTVPAYVDIMGLGFATNSVTVNGQTAWRKVEYYRQQLAVTNTGAAVWQSVSNVQTGQATVTGNLFVPQSPESYGYDADGNLTSDGRWTYTWDAENRLLALTPRTGVGPANSIRFEYDCKGRRIRKQVWSNTTWSGTPTNDAKFLYDGWNAVGKLNATNSAVLQYYVWGLDLSGSMQGAGGVGGLLELNDSVNGVDFVAYDGNGNVAGLTQATDGTIPTRYEYGPFGEVLRMTGPMAKANPFRFSTKFDDDETDFLYYGYRYYNPSTGRWLNRDPLAEYAFALQSSFSSPTPLWSGPKDAIGAIQDHIEDVTPVVYVGNQTTSFVDGLGLFKIVNTRDIYPDPCEMVIVYGHSNGKSYRWKWHMNRTPSAGGAVTCFPAKNIQGLVDENNLWVEADQIFDELIWWLPLSDVSPQNSLDVPRNKNRDINANAAMYTQVLPRVMTKIEPFCKLCTQVTITLIRVRKDGTIFVNPTGNPGKSDDRKWPNIPSSVLSCQSGGNAPGSGGGGGCGK